MPKAAFLADGHAAIGGGHVIRSLSLATALGARGIESVFLGGDFIRDAVARFGEGPVSWVETAPSGSRDYAASVKAAVATLDPDLVVFDHYQFGAEEHRAIADGRPSVLIDELGDRPIFVDIVVDPTPEREAGAYDGLSLKNARFLFGPRHALLRPRFAAARAEGKRDPEMPVRRVLLTMGLTDLGGITGRITGAIVGDLGERSLEIVVGETAPSYAKLETLSKSDGRISLRSQVRDMAQLMESADICLGAGGGTTWERCALGLPTILTVIADNQRQYAQEVRRADAAIVLELERADYDSVLTEAFRKLCGDGGLRGRLSEASAKLCDGRGAERVAAAIVEMLESRPVTAGKRGD